MSATLERRLREMRSRVLVRSWDYRQRNLARGVWFRLRRVLADAREAFIVPLEEARGLVGEGARVASVGSELEPPKLIVFATAERVASIRSARPVPVRLSPDVLAAEALVLVPFDARASR
jgi:hypothetical protein